VYLYLSKGLSWGRTHSLQGILVHKDEERFIEHFNNGYKRGWAVEYRVKISKSTEESYETNTENELE